MHAGTRGQASFGPTRPGGLKAALAATALAGIAILPAGARAETVTPHAVKPQAVSPQVLTPPPPPAASPAPEPAPTPDPGEPVENSPPASVAAPTRNPAPSPRSPDIQVPNRAGRPVSLDGCDLRCQQRRRAMALSYVMGLASDMHYAVEHPMSMLQNVSPPEPPAIETAAQTVEDMIRAAVGGGGRLLEKLLFAEN
jgi:hypothetical protein